MHFNTIQEIKDFDRARGGHFFSKGALAFFRSEIHPGVHGGRFFITSEQFCGSEGICEPRAYTIREVTSSGAILSAGDFQKYATLDEARAAASAAISPVAEAEEGSHP